jgi:hypothetical protein
MVSIINGAPAAGSLALSGDVGCMEASVEEEADMTWEGVGLDLKRSVACFLFMGSEEEGLGFEEICRMPTDWEVMARVGRMVAELLMGWRFCTADVVLSTVGVGGVIVIEGGDITILEGGRGDLGLPFWKAGIEWKVGADGLAESFSLLSMYSTVWWAGL